MQIVIRAGSATALVSSLNPSIFGQAVTFTATVGSTPPAGFRRVVTFTDGRRAARVGRSRRREWRAFDVGTGQREPLDHEPIYGGNGELLAEHVGTLTQTS